LITLLPRRPTCALLPYTTLFRASFRDGAGAGSSGFVRWPKREALIVAEASSSQVVRLSSTDRVIDPRKFVLDRVLRNTGRVLIDSVAATVYSAMDRAKVKNAENITGPRMFGM